MKQVLALALGLVLLQSCQKQQVILNIENPRPVTLLTTISFVDSVNESNGKSPVSVPIKAQVSVDRKSFAGKWQMGLSITLVSPVPKNGWYFTYELFDKNGKSLGKDPYNKQPLLTKSIPNAPVRVLGYPEKKVEDARYILRVKIGAVGSNVNIPESSYEFDIED